MRLCILANFMANGIIPYNISKATVNAVPYWGGGFQPPLIKLCICAAFSRILRRLYTQHLRKLIVRWYYLSLYRDPFLVSFWPYALVSVSCRHISTRNGSHRKAKGWRAVGDAPTSVQRYHPKNITNFDSDGVASYFFL